MIGGEPGVELDYFEIVNGDTLLPADKNSKKHRCACCRQGGENQVDR